LQRWQNHARPRPRRRRLPQRPPRRHCGTPSFPSARWSSIGSTRSNNTEDWWQAIPEEIRPRKDQPFYHLLAENAETTYVAYVSEQNLLADKTGQPVRHPQVKEMFALDGKGHYRARFLQSH
jgi:heat shock protein HspQ